MAELQVDYSPTRPRACAFFAGRAWYAGVDSGSKSGWVLFSQVVTTVNNLGKCYQENDPTSEIFSDLKDDDGGVVPIPDAGTIICLKTAGSVLLVFGTNGVWSIRGGDQGFKATDYTVEKISSTGAVSAKAVVSVDDVIMYWAANAIYAIKMDQNGIGQVQNLTDTTIKTYYQDIPLLCKQYAQGIYNRTEQVVYFTFSSSADNFTTYGNFFKDSLLKFDITLKCFYLERLTVGYPHITNVATTTEVYIGTQNFYVYAGGDIVAADGYDVLSYADVPNSASSQTKFLSVDSGSGNNTVSFAEYSNSREDFQDWGDSENSAYIITGYNMGGVGPVRNKTAPMITVFAKKTETYLDADLNPTTASSIKMQTRWDFTDNSYPGKWSDEYEVYRQLRPYFTNTAGTTEDGYPLIITRNKVRGRGKALQIKWSAGTNKDLQMVGWSINFVGNTQV
jgi:hypothetical protein